MSRPMSSRLHWLITSSSLLRAVGGWSPGRRSLARRCRCTCGPTGRAIACMARYRVRRLDGLAARGDRVDGRGRRRSAGRRRRRPPRLSHRQRISQSRGARTSRRHRRLGRRGAGKRELDLAILAFDLTWRAPGPIQQRVERYCSKPPTLISSPRSGTRPRCVCSTGRSVTFPTTSSTGSPSPAGTFPPQHRAAPKRWIVAGSSFAARAAPATCDRSDRSRPRSAATRCGRCQAMHTWFPAASITWRFGCQISQPRRNRGAGYRGARLGAISGMAGGRSWRHGSVYIVFEQSPDLSGDVHDRLAPGLNHLAFTVADAAEVDRLTAASAAHGWSLMFADRHPHAGGPDTYAAYLEDGRGLRSRNRRCRLMTARRTSGPRPAVRDGEVRARCTAFRWAHAAKAGKGQ